MDGFLSVLPHNYSFTKQSTSYRVHTHADLYKLANLISAKLSRANVLQHTKIEYVILIAKMASWPSFPSAFHDSN